MNLDRSIATPRSGRRIILLGTLLCCAFPLAADPPAGKPGKGNKPAKGDSSVAVAISAGIEFEVARRLAAEHGLVGGKPLPPGIRKNLAAGKPLPPGIARTRLPDGFIGALPEHPGYEWQRLGTDLVLVAVGTLIIAEILENVFD